MSALATFRRDMHDTVSSTLGAAFLVVGHHGTFGEPEIRNYGARAPAVVLTISGAKSNRHGGSIYVDLSCTAFVLTRAAADDRTDAALTVYERLAHLLHVTDWGAGTDDARMYKTPRDIEARNLYGEMLDKQQIALWGVQWLQTICLPPLVAYGALDDFARLYVTNENARPTELAADTDASVQAIEPEQ